MNGFVLFVILFLISFFWALLSLKKELSKPKEVEDATKELNKEKILFKFK